MINTAIPLLGPSSPAASAITHDVTIVTTCAKDHVTWNNHYPAGESRAGALRLLRFPVEHPRDLHRFVAHRDVVVGRRPAQQPVPDGPTDEPAGIGDARELLERAHTGAPSRWYVRGTRAEMPHTIS